MTTTDETTTGDQARNESSTDESEVPAPAETEVTQDDTRPANREARYRTERNEAREQVAELEVRTAELEARVEALQQREVARIAAETLADGWDLLTFAPGVEDLLDEHGNPDHELVTARAQELVGWKPGLARGVVVRQGGSPTGFGQGTRALADTDGTTWGSVLKGR